MHLMSFYAVLWMEPRALNVGDGLALAYAGYSLQQSCPSLLSAEVSRSEQHALPRPAPLGFLCLQVLGLMLPISTAGSQGVKLSKTCSFSGMIGSSKLQLPLEL